MSTNLPCGSSAVNGHCHCRCRHPALLLTIKAHMPPLLPVNAHADSSNRHNAAMQKGIHFIAAIRGGARTITQGFFRCWDRCSGRCHRMHVRDIFQRGYWKRRRREDVRWFCYVLKLKLNVEDNVFGVRDATESSRDSSRCGHQHAHRGCLALSD